MLLGVNSSNLGKVDLPRPGGFSDEISRNSPNLPKTCMLHDSSSIVFVWQFVWALRVSGGPWVLRWP